MRCGLRERNLRPVLLVCLFLFLAFPSLARHNEAQTRKYGMQIVDGDVKPTSRGKRFNEDPIEICRACTPGSFSNEGNLKCAECDLPGWCPNITYCILCPEGTFSDQPNSTSCTQCPDGFITRSKNMTKCNACPPGQTSSATHTSCPACIPGTFNPKPGGVCSPCGKGQFQSAYGGYNCTSCPPASWNDQIGQAACVNCGKGRWGVQGGAITPDACSECPEGYYCPQPNTTKPMPCPSDHYCETGSSSPSSCPFLFQSPAISTTCRPSTYFYLIFAGLGGLILVFAVVVWITVSRYRSKKKKKARIPKGRSEVESLIPEPLPGPVYNGL